MKLTIVVSAAAMTAAFASVALAAAFGVAPRDLGAGNTPVVACDTNGFLPSYTTTRGNVTAVTVSAIADPGCEGGSLAVTLTNAAGSSIATAGPQTVPADGDAVDNSMTLSTSPQPGASQLAGYHISVTGP